MKIRRLQSRAVLTKLVQIYKVDMIMRGSVACFERQDNIQNRAQKNFEGISHLFRIASH